MNIYSLDIEKESRNKSPLMMSGYNREITINHAATRKTGEYYEHLYDHKLAV